MYPDADLTGYSAGLIAPPDPHEKINQPGGTGLSCKLNRTINYVQLNLFDNFRATENLDLSS
jgi:hypothetical protein